MSENPKSVILRIDQISIDNSIQQRILIDSKVVEDYAEKISNGTTMPPISVCHDTKNGTYWLWDGFHRITAFQKAGYLYGSTETFQKSAPCKDRYTARCQPRALSYVLGRHPRHIYSGVQHCSQI